MSGIPYHGPSDGLSVAWLGLGSNLESPARQIRTALATLAADPGLRILAISGLYRTTPVGGPAGQSDYCNACVALATGYTPLVLLDVMQAIEQAQARVRDVRWGPRTLDLDLLAFDDLGLTHERLTLPHPRAAERGFVLVPLAEIAPALQLGTAGRVADLKAAVGAAGVTRWHAA